jgi:hypothetical protein
MECIQIILPCKLPLLLCLDPQCVDFIDLLLLLRNVVITFLLKLRQLYSDFVAFSWSYVWLIEHLNGHVYWLKHSKTNPRVTLCLPRFLVSVYFNLFLSRDWVEPQHSTSHKVISEFIFCDVCRQSLHVDVVVDLGLEPLALLVFLVPLLLQSLLFTEL